MGLGVGEGIETVVSGAQTTATDKMHLSHIRLLFLQDGTTETVTAEGCGFDSGQIADAFRFKLCFFQRVQVSVVDRVRTPVAKTTNPT